MGMRNNNINNTVSIKKLLRFETIFVVPRIDLQLEAGAVICIHVSELELRLTNLYEGLGG